MKNLLQWVFFIGAVSVLSAQVTFACTSSGDTSFAGWTPAECFEDEYCAGVGGHSPNDYCTYQECGPAVPCVGVAAYCVPHPWFCYYYATCGSQTEC